MKSEQLNEAFGKVDDKYLDFVETQKIKKHSLKNRLIAAAVLACLLVGGITGFMLSHTKDQMILAKAEYPNMPKKPNFDDYFDENGSITSEAQIRYSDDHLAWLSAERDLLDVPSGFSANLDTFWKTAICEVLSKENGKNKLVSPANLYMAFALLAEVADGNTRAEILNTLNTADIEQLRDQANQLWRSLYRNSGEEFSILANSIWLNDNVSYNKKTVDCLAKNYYTSSFHGKMGSDKFNKVFQDWLNEQTGNLLEKYVANENLYSDTILALASTISFYGKWSSEFSPSATEAGDFSKNDGTTVSVDYMHSSGTDKYYCSDHYGAFCKMTTSSFGMWFILPDEGYTPEQLLAEDDIYTMFSSPEQWEQQKRIIINLSLPKFDVSSQELLKEHMQAMGIQDAFDITSADFSPLTGDTEGINLTDVSHAVRVAIDEKGVTGAAYTTEFLCGSALPPEEEIDLVFDRPFLFVITDLRNYLPLFVGIVNDPSVK